MEAVIFIGIQATGKSTFYAQYFAQTHVHISMDVLKKRSKEDALIASCTAARKPFVVDNTNVSIREREKYITRAAQAGYRVFGYYFLSSLKDTLMRNEQRIGKAVIPVMGVIAKFRALQPPSFEEGFDLLYTVSIDSQSSFRVQKIEDPSQLFP
jgi:predicted kinase